VRISGGEGSSADGARGTFAALSVRNFRRYVSGQALSLIGTWVETVAQALLVLSLTHSGVVLGLTTAARFAPVLVLSPYAGLLVDRFPKRCVLLITQTGLGVVSLALGILLLSGHVGLGQVVVLALAFGTFSAVDNPARQAFVGEVVGRDLIRNAVTLNSTAVNVARLIGALGAGAVIGGLYAARSQRTGLRRLTRAAAAYAVAAGLLAAAPTLPAAVAACAITGVASVVFLTAGNSTIQLTSDPAYRGRITALWSLALVGSTPIGSPIIGAVSQLTSPRWALALGAAACAVAAAIGHWPISTRSQ
jgi:MFS family permease